MRRTSTPGRKKSSSTIMPQQPPSSSSASSAASFSSGTAPMDPDELKEQYNVDVMIEVKTKRKNAESDLQLLANRIALLRSEEAKALNKINETKARVEELQQIKKRNEDVAQKQISHTLTREISIKTAHERAVADRDQMRSRLSQSRKNVEDTNRLKATEKKFERQRMEDMAISFRIQAESERRKRAEDIKKREALLRQQREKEKAEKELAAKLEYARRIEAERRRKAEADEAIRVLEQQERQLIERLKKAQTVQHEAYEELQKAFEL